MTASSSVCVCVCVCVSLCVCLSVQFCSVLQPSSFPGLATPPLIDSSMVSPVHVLMLSIQAVRGLPRLRAPDMHYLPFVTPLFPHGVTIIC